MRSVYTSIVIFFAAYGIALVADFLSQREEVFYSHIFTSEGEVKVSPDTVYLELSRRDPLSSSPSLAAQSVREPISTFLKASEGKVRLEPLELNFLTYQNSKFIARAYEASQDAVISLNDVSKLPALLEIGLNAGMNEIGAAEFSVSIAQQQAAEVEAKKIAKEQIIADAELFAKQMGRVLIHCIEPSGSYGTGYGGGNPGMAGGMALTESPDAEPVSKFIRPLAEMVIDEPKFDGPVHVAKTIIPPEVSITGTETLACEFN